MTDIEKKPVGRPKADPDRKLESITIALYEDQLLYAATRGRTSTSHEVRRLVDLGMQVDRAETETETETEPDDLPTHTYQD